VAEFGSSKIFNYELCIFFTDHPLDGNAIMYIGSFGSTLCNIEKNNIAFYFHSSKIRFMMRCYLIVKGNCIQEHVPTWVCTWWI
jgi:hypothetical protein